MEKDNKPWDIASARRHLEASLFSRLRKQSVASETTMASGDSQSMAVGESGIANQPTDQGETTSFVQTFERKPLIESDLHKNENQCCQKNVRAEVMIDLTTEEYDEQPRSEIFSAISVPELPQEIQVVPSDSPDNRQKLTAQQQAEVEKDTETIMWSEAEGTIDQPSHIFHHMHHQHRLEHPQRRAAKQRKNMFNYTRSDAIPVSLNIASRMQRFPRSHIAIHASHTRVRTNHAAPSTLPHPPDRPTNTTDSHLMPNLHHNFLERLPEQTVLGAIFLNNLIQQSVMDYQSLRSKMYPQILPQRMMQHRPASANSHVSKPVHCREFCPIRRGYSISHAKVTNQIQAQAASGMQAATTPVTATFTLPSTSSTSSSTMQHHNIRYAIIIVTTSLT